MTLSNVSSDLSFLNITVDEIDTLLAPYTEQTFGLNDPEWRGMVKGWEKQFRTAGRKAWWRRLIRRRSERTYGAVKIGYEKMWGRENLNNNVLHASGAKLIPLIWRDKGYMGPTETTKRFHQLFFMRAFAKYNPVNALEVGCGAGHVLMPMAARFPNTNFTGFELTDAGIEIIKGVQQETLPQTFSDFSPEPLVDLNAHKAIEIVQGNALELPFPDNSFEFVYTSLALEQMNPIRKQVMEQIARVAGKYVVLCEPWRDFNNEGIARDYIVMKDYFAAWVEDLKSYSLKPVFASDDMPAKYWLRMGFVIAEKI
jgi:SAM-dependent methyltransferase